MPVSVNQYSVHSSPVSTLPPSILPCTTFVYQVYDFNLWARHRSSSRYTRHLVTTFKSEIIRGILGPVYLMALFATAVCVYEYALAAGTLPPNFPDIAVDLDISGPFTLSTFALSLLLAYRTNASYGRFDEARKFWGGVVNRSRDLMRQAR